MNRSRVGKIARLPKDVRDRINTMLRDGHPFADIIALVQSGQGIELNEQNITNWREGGYQDWLREAERLEDMRLKREFALEVVRQNEGSKIHEATLQLAASQLYEVLTEFDLGPLQELLAEKPALYPKIVSSIAKLSKEALGYEKFRAAVAAQLTAAKTEAREKGGITAETIERIERELKLL